MSRIDEIGERWPRHSDPSRTVSEEWAVGDVHYLLDQLAVMDLALQWAIDDLNGTVARATNLAWTGNTCTAESMKTKAVKWLGGEE